MNIRRQPLKVRLLFSAGLLLVVLPAPISSLITMPHFLRGFLVGLGLAMEITALIIMRKSKDQYTATGCA